VIHSDRILHHQLARSSLPGGAAAASFKYCYSARKKSQGGRGDHGHSRYLMGEIYRLLEGFSSGYLADDHLPFPGQPDSGNQACAEVNHPRLILGI